MLLVGKAGGPEERLVPEAGFDLATVPIRGFDRDAVWKNLALPGLLPAAIWKGAGIVSRFRPDVVLGMAGYAMTPAVIGARIKGVPYVLHEQNVAAGLATRMFASGAAAICVTLPGAERGLGGRRVEMTGLPLRPGFVPRTPPAPPRRLLITGGSQGARRINQTVWAALDALLERFQEVVHLTGRQGEEEARRYWRPRYRPITFADDMPAVLAGADAVVSRAGVGTMAEVTAVGLPLVLIPGTFGGGHQAANAAALVSAGAAIRLGDGELSPESLIAALDSPSSDGWRRMAAASRALGRLDAAQRVLRVLDGVLA